MRANCIAPRFQCGRNPVLGRSVSCQSAPRWNEAGIIRRLMLRPILTRQPLHAIRALLPLLHFMRARGEDLNVSVVQALIRPRFFGQIEIAQRPNMVNLPLAAIFPTDAVAEHHFEVRLQFANIATNQIPCIDFGKRRIFFSGSHLAITRPPQKRHPHLVSSLPLPTVLAPRFFLIMCQRRQISRLLSLSCASVVVATTRSKLCLCRLVHFLSCFAFDLFLHSRFTIYGESIRSQPRTQPNERARFQLPALCRVVK